MIIKLTRRSILGIFIEILKNDEGKTVLADLCRTDNFQCTDKKWVPERIRISPDLYQIKSGLVTLNLKIQNVQEYDKIIFSYISYCFGCPIESISLSTYEFKCKKFLFNKLLALSVIFKQEIPINGFDKFLISS